jgi:hypothetical protein
VIHLIRFEGTSLPYNEKSIDYETTRPFNDDKSERSVKVIGSNLLCLINFKDFKYVLNNCSFWGFENDMKSNNEVFGKYKDETGEEYFCPINAVADNRIVSEWELDNCVEASTAGRYSGHLDIVD